MHADDIAHARHDADAQHRDADASARRHGLRHSRVALPTLQSHVNHSSSSKRSAELLVPWNHESQSNQRAADPAGLQYAQYGTQRDLLDDSNASSPASARDTSTDSALFLAAKSPRASAKSSGPPLALSVAVDSSGGPSSPGCRGGWQIWQEVHALSVPELPN